MRRHRPGAEKDNGDWAAASVLETLHGGRNTSAAGHKGVTALGVDGHDGGGAQQAAEFHRVPTTLPGAGMRRTAVVLELTMPMAASSAMMAERVAAVVSPGTAIMSKPTEHTQVMASSLSRWRAPERAAAIMPSSSLTGMKAPDRPPTWEEAMTPPFFTASLSRARAAVVPWCRRSPGPFPPECGPHCRRWRGGGQGEIHDAEGHAQPAAGLLGY